MSRSNAQPCFKIHHSSHPLFKVLDWQKGQKAVKGCKISSHHVFNMPRVWNCSRVLQFASQSEHPLYTQAGECSGMSAWGRSWCKPISLASRVGKNPRDHHRSCPFQWLWHCNSSAATNSVCELPGWFSKGVYVPGTEMISALDSWI